MASSNRGGGTGEEQLKKLAELNKTLKEGERIIAPTRRPDGTLRKPIRIRAGHVPQEEVAIYQSKGALWKKEMALQVASLGYDPALDVDARPNTKAARRNERKKEKRHQAAMEKEKQSVESTVAGDMIQGELEVEQDLNHEALPVESLSSMMTELALSSDPCVINPPPDSANASNVGNPVQDTDKKIRALRKKIRLAEAQQKRTSQQEMQQEQLEKLGKLEGWREELKLLEDKKATGANRMI